MRTLVGFALFAVMVTSCGGERPAVTPVIRDPSPSEKAVYRKRHAIVLSCLKKATRSPWTVAYLSLSPATPSVSLSASTSALNVPHSSLDHPRQTTIPLHISRFRGYNVLDPKQFTERRDQGRAVAIGSYRGIDAVDLFPLVPYLIDGAEAVVIDEKRPGWCLDRTVRYAVPNPFLECELAVHPYKANLSVPSAGAAETSRLFDEATTVIQDISQCLQLAQELYRG